MFLSYFLDYAVYYTMLWVRRTAWWLLEMAQLMGETLACQGQCVHTLQFHLQHILLAR